MTGLAAHNDRFLSHLLARDTRAAIDLALALADDGVPLAVLLTEMVGPAQAEVGERWHRNLISVADEHAATAVADAVVSVLTASSLLPASGPMVVVTCAEGEWHTIPPRLVAEVLRIEGFAASFLGPSMPASHLARFLGKTTPAFLAISCSTPLALVGVLACTQSAHEAGVPVIAGGRGLGPDGHRARTLGCDLWAPSARAGAELLKGPAPDRFREPSADLGSALALSLSRDELVAAAMEALVHRLPLLAQFDEEKLARTREDYGFIVSFAAAAVLTGDERLFVEFLGWLDGLLCARGLPPGTLAVSLDALADAPCPPSLLGLLEESRAGSALSAARENT